MKSRYLIKQFIVSFIVILCFGTIVFAEMLDNDVKVKPKSDLTYYLNVDYDGVDESATVSSDNGIANVKSGFIEVTDKLPEGLTFKGIVEPVDEDGNPVSQIGAVKRSNNSVCSGYVVGGVDGITYDEDTHSISFKVKNLGAGCRLTVGVITTTPEIDDPNTSVVENRRDFYNVFSAVEDDLSVISNQVHVYMGNDDETLYSVTYEYTGDVPSNAPTLPSEIKYASGSNVGVNSDVNVTGYRFSGWSTSGVTVNNGKFTMPSSNVTFKGSFEALPKYSVTYQIEGEYPESYIIPTSEEYYEGNSVDVDILKEGDIVDGYRFLGWTTDDVNVVDDSFVMPNKNITIKGSFEKISYKVIYRFQGTVIPDNSDELLPLTKEYYPGDIVKLEYPKEVEGYKFLGWYKKDNFKMPSEDVIIYGEWMEVRGLFEPSIQIDIVNKKDIYNIGDKVKFKITVTNNEDYDIKNVMVRNNNELVYFINGDNYEVSSKHLVTIPSIKAKNSIIIYSEYEVTDKSLPEEVNEVEIVGAQADNKYVINTDKKYKANIKFNTTQEEQKEETKKDDTSKGVSVGSTSNSVPKIILITFSILFIIGLIIFGYSYIKSKHERRKVQ